MLHPLCTNYYQVFMITVTKSFRSLYKTLVHPSLQNCFNLPLVLNVDGLFKVMRLDFKYPTINPFFCHPKVDFSVFNVQVSCRKKSLNSKSQTFLSFFYVKRVLFCLWVSSGFDLGTLTWFQNLPGLFL